MWSEALRLLERADRLHRQFFLAHEPSSWEPPVDIVERGDELHLQLALPGVSPTRISIAVDGRHQRSTPCAASPAASTARSIHRLEIPYGRFVRRIELPLGDRPLELAGKTLHDGMLTLTFRRKEGA